MKIKKYIPLTEEEKIRANNVDLAEFLRSRGEDIERSGHEWRWKRHDSVTINGNWWCRHSVDVGSKKLGGGPVKFLQEFGTELYGSSMTYPEIVLELNGGLSGAALREAARKPPPEKKEFTQPERFGNMNRVYAYLMKQRGIDADIISHFAKAGTLYEDAKYHNTVFAGLDEKGVMRHAHKKSTYTLGNSFCGNVEGSNSKYGFCHIGGSRKIHAFEAPIDMLSYISLYKENWQQDSYIALNGISPQALIKALEIYPHIREPVLCLDNDKTGIAAMDRITKELATAGYDEVSCRLSFSKDWNEDLVQLRQQPEQEDSHNTPDYGVISM